MIIKLLTLLISLAVSVYSQHQCGLSKKSSEITKVLSNNGSLAEDAQWPWAAGLFLKNGNQRQFLCSGTLISDQYILTAAHCIENKGPDQRLSADQISTTLGAVDISNNNGVIYDVIEIKIHPEWNATRGTKFDADLAIIKLNQSVKLSENIQPVCLPLPDEKVFEVTGFMVGYGTYSNENGLDEKLRYFKIPTVSQEDCLLHSGVKRTFCGGDLSKNACKSDSGAGFVVESHFGSSTIIGIVSSATISNTENCKFDSYVVFTNVPKFVNWILTETGRADVISHQVWNPYNSSTNVIPPNSVYVYEGDIKAYVARHRFSDDSLTVGKFLEKWKSIFVPYYGGEPNFHHGIEILATSKKHQWIPFTGTFPYNAVLGGYEGSARTFVGRKTIDGKHVIGKVIDKTIYVPYYSKEHKFKEFEILILSDEGWIPYNSSTDPIPHDSISVDEGDIKTYVARRRYENNVIVGKFVPNLKLIYLPFMGIEYKFEDGIEILTTGKKHEWIPFNGTFPNNAVIGGYEGSAKLYVGRTMHDCKNVIGKIIDTTKKIYIGYFSKEYEYSELIEILVLL
ncbi:uncharacterized protein [Chironomus tepperi]|uniref:uncharacterized protein n=1 Tax=Chironomus tepperi TaxID=113505 RepID=UPI00391F0B54